MTLKTIAAPVRNHLDAFDGMFNRAIRSDVLLVDLIARYIIRRKGKQVRPILVFLSAGACGGVTEASYRGAALVEILHTATLIHDDVVDEADTRRGFPSINAVWKNKLAILMGDYLLAKGLLLALEHDDFGFLTVTSRSVRRMSEGEIHQIQRIRRLDMDEEAYFRIIGDKTASLIATCCEIGAGSATSDPALRERLRLYGEHVGTAFQIRDDLLDYVGRRSITGKPTGLDLSEKKLTLPLIHALAQAPKAEARAILRLVKEGGKKGALGEVMDFVERRGGIAYAERRAEEFAARAAEALGPLPDSPARNSLLAFAEFVIRREK
ncbi:MAG: polyprenyl synthetase family protein [Bacteroidota bacterium]